VLQLEDFLTRVVQQTKVKKLHLIAHSMGNRALTQALEHVAMREPPPAKFGQVILAAPDVDADEFRTRYAPVVTRLADHVTLYASSYDRALLASTRVHGYTRAGLSGEHLIVCDGLDTVDVSPIDTSLIGHSYYGDNPLMIRDLEAVIALSLPPDGRGWLQRMLRLPTLPYWTFRHDLPPEELPPEEL
jgi:esterase/lipase superfamily enzyme